MKYVKLTIVFLSISLFVFPSFTKQEATAKRNVALANKNTMSAKKNLDLTLYVWFDAYNDFLGLNLVDDECSWTGYDQFNYPPYTVQEKGFQLVHVYYLGFGLYIPINPYCPDKVLYSHP